MRTNIPVELKRKMQDTFMSDYTMTYKQISEKFNIKLETIVKRISKRNWYTGESVTWKKLRKFYREKGKKYDRQKEVQKGVQVQKREQKKVQQEKDKKEQQKTLAPNKQMQNYNAIQGIDQKALIKEVIDIHVKYHNMYVSACRNELKRVLREVKRKAKADGFELSKRLALRDRVYIKAYESKLMKAIKTSKEVQQMEKALYIDDKVETINNVMVNFTRIDNLNIEQIDKEIDRIKDDIKLLESITA